MSRPAAFVMLASLLGGNCQAQTSVADRTSVDRGAACEPLPLIGALAGRTVDSFVRANGTPARSEDFVVRDGLNPDRRVLLNVLRRPRDDALTIREMEWRGKQCRLVIWFAVRGGKWTSIQALRTSLDAEA